MITRLDRHLTVPIDYAADLLDTLDLLSEVLRYASDELRHDIVDHYQPGTYEYLIETVGQLQERKVGDMGGRLRQVHQLLSIDIVDWRIMLVNAMNGYVQFIHLRGVGDLSAEKIAGPVPQLTIIEGTKNVAGFPVRQRHAFRQQR